jgi:predicted ATPase
MIRKVTIKNFKSITDQSYDFTDFDLLVGRNNSGKSSILQALAIWQYCVDEFRRNKERRGKTGIQIVLPNFTALPVPEFNLLWTDKTERKYSPNGSKKKTPEYILIEINVEWDATPSDGAQPFPITGETSFLDQIPDIPTKTEILRDSNHSAKKMNNFAIHLRYQAPQSAYAIPGGGWKRFKELEENHNFPRIVYVPPFSGLETFEKWNDDSIIRQQVGKAQPGSVLRNLLYRIVDKKDEVEDNKEWNELKKILSTLFSIELAPPLYEKGVDTQITCTYTQRGKQFDIISGGSGFHQTLTLLAFLYGYKGLSTICFDEPDAHMHSNLQSEMLDLFRKLSKAKKIQFLIATHSGELIKGVPPTNVYSVLTTVPKRIEANDRLLTALSDVGNPEIAHAMQSPFILYIEGETDQRLIRAWGNVLGKTEPLGKFFFKTMGGGTKKEMADGADRHFKGLSLIIPALKRIMVFDYDSDKTSFNLGPENPTIFEWPRKNIENYLLVSDAWLRAANLYENTESDSLFQSAIDSTITNFFANENLTLPANSTWENVEANVFKVVDGKRLLFSDPKSLFNMLREKGFGLKKADSNNISREDIALQMKPSEIHKDIKSLFSKLEGILPGK